MASVSNTENTIQQYLWSTIPVSKFMEIQVVSCAERNVILQAPLLPSINHLGSMFGGSLYSLAALSGYVFCLAELLRDGEKSLPEIHIAIANGSIRYLKPATTSKVQARVDSASATLVDSRRGKWQLESSLFCGENRVAVFKGEFLQVTKPKTNV